MGGWLSLVAALSLAASPAGTLDVPYLSQPRALCGGAAVAMVFRYWGDAHASVQQFAPLVDRRAGGIADDRLIAAVAARGWRATPIVGSLDRLRDEIGRRHPVVALIEDRPSRYHYVVVIGMDAAHVIVHDPALGPARAIAFAAWNRAWRPANFWGLIVEPGEKPPTESVERSAGAIDAPQDPGDRPDACDRLLADAVADVRRRGLDQADAILGPVRAQCPHAAGPLRELAGVRFAQRRWREAADLARQAVALDPHDEYAWTVLASSRFVQDDLDGALAAWNAIGQPQIDLVQIRGLEHTRYELMTRELGLSTNTLLTDAAFKRAARRVADLPGNESARLSYRPADDGFAVIDLAVNEHDPVPRGASEWAATAARLLIDREADVALPGNTGQGEVWEASWRWWNNRPRAALSFAAPRAGWMPGVWRVEASWEQQTYGTGVSTGAALVRETRVHGGLTVSDWLTGNLKYELTVGVDNFGLNRRGVLVGGALQRRLAGDRIALFGDVNAWTPVAGGSRFEAGSVRALLTPTGSSSRWLFTADLGVDAVTASAPFALWPGAGDGHGRPILLRAHPLLDDGVVDGPAFGRTLAHASAEAQRWFEHGKLIRLGVAGFTDAARASRGLSAADPPTLVDVGGGLRVRIPGVAGTVRVDLGVGVRDGARAASVGWQK